MAWTLVVHAVSHSCSGFGTRGPDSDEWYGRISIFWTKAYFLFTLLGHRAGPLDKLEVLHRPRRHSVDFWTN